MESPILTMRKKLFMTQQELALSLNVCQSSISKVENGLVQIPERAIESLQEIYVDSGRVVELQKKFVNYKGRELRGRIRALQLSR